MPMGSNGEERGHMNKQVLEKHCSTIDQPVTLQVVMEGSCFKCEVQDSLNQPSDFVPREHLIFEDMKALQTPSE